MRNFRHNTIRPQRRTTRRGAALGMVVVLMLLLSISSMTMMQVGRDARLRTISSNADIAAYYAAESGIEHTLYLMNQALQADTWTVDSVPPTFTAAALPDGNAHYTVTFTRQGPTTFTVTSVGRSGTSVRTVQARIELTNPFAYVALSRHSIGLENRVTVKGSFGALSGTTGSVDIKNHTTLDGDIYIGPGADPDEVIDNRSDLNGEVFILPLPPSFEPVTPPNLTHKGNITDSAVLTAADSGIYDTIDLGTRDTLTIRGDCVLVVTGDITLDNRVEINIDPGSTLTLYLAGDMTAHNRSRINTLNAAPSQFTLYGTGDDQQIQFINDALLYGAFYAPNATLTLDGNAVGSFIVGDFQLKTNGSVVYDPVVNNATLSDDAIWFSVVRWEEI